MKRKEVLAVAVVLVSLAGVWSAADAQKRQLALGSTQTSSSNYAYFVGAAKAINLLAP